MKEKTFASMLVTGALSSAISYFALGPRVAIGAATGATLAILNWYALRWITTRLLQKGQAGSGRAGLFLLVKFAVLAGIVWALLRWARLDAIGFVIGLGASLFGMLIGAGGSAPRNSSGAEQGDQSATR